MPSTHLSLHFHVVFSTKDRAPWIEKEWRDRLHAFIDLARKMRPACRSYERGVGVVQTTRLTSGAGYGLTTLKGGVMIGKSLR